MQAWFESLKADFILNFVQANRWKYLWDGLGRTLLITLLAGVMGTIIGVIIAMVRSTYDKTKEGARMTIGRRLFAVVDWICRVYLTVLRGTPLAEIGKEVLAGEELVGNWFSTQEGEQVRVEPIARASIACVYDSEIAAEKEECAFAIAYLEAGIQDTDGVTKKEIIKTDGGYRVRLEYTVVESINF